jgi:hypothetical protein
VTLLCLQWSVSICSNMCGLTAAPSAAHNARFEKRRKSFLERAALYQPLLTIASSKLFLSLILIREVGS